MFTHSTGMMENGVAFTLSGSRRWAEEGYVEGTNYDAWAYSIGIEKSSIVNIRLHSPLIMLPSKGVCKEYRPMRQKALQEQATTTPTGVTRMAKNATHAFGFSKNLPLF